MTSNEQRDRRLRVPAVPLAALLALAGTAALTVGDRSQRHAPQPPASAGIPYSASASPSAQERSRARGRAAAPGAAARKGLILKAATPTHLDIPAIGLSSDLLRLGLNPDRTVQVPPLGRDAPAGWYRYSPTPGQLGPAILLGHVDSARDGPGVFFNLGALRPGDTVTTTRADHTAAVFRVDRVVSYPKDHFPTLDVYGNIDHAALRLITCGGPFDLGTGGYESNIVVYASLISSHPA